MAEALRRRWREKQRCLSEKLGWEGFAITVGRSRYHHLASTNTLVRIARLCELTWRNRAG